MNFSSLKRKQECPEDALSGQSEELLVAYAVR
jgi:hypothetical protein